MNYKPLSKRDRLLAFAVLTFALILQACGGGANIGGPGGVINSGGAVVKRLFASHKPGTVLVPSHASSAPFAAALFTGTGFAAAPAPAQFQQGYDAQCDFSHNAGFLASVPVGGVVQLDIPGNPEPCTSFNTPASVGVGKKTVTDGTLTGLSVQITTFSNQFVTCRDLTTQTAITDLSSMQPAIVRTDTSINVVALVTPNGGTANIDAGFNCTPALTVAPSDIKTIEVNLAKI